MNDTINFEDNCFVQFLLVIKKTFPLKLLNTDCIIPGFYKQFILKKLLSDLKVNYSVNIENHFSYVFSCYFRVP